MNETISMLLNKRIDFDKALNGYPFTARVWFSSALVCLSVFFRKKHPARITKLHVQIPRRVLETHLFWLENFKGQVHESQNSVGVCRCTLVSSGYF